MSAPTLPVPQLLSDAPVAVDIDSMALAAATKIMHFCGPELDMFLSLAEINQIKAKIQCEVRDAMAAYRPLAAEQTSSALGSADIQDLVTRESALAAIQHLDQSNSAGRDRDARAMLVAAQLSPVLGATENRAVEVARPDLASLQRYELVEHQHGRGHMIYWDKTLDEASDGAMVRFADVEALFAPKAPDTTTGTGEE